MVHHPQGRKPTSWKWIFNKKLKLDGSIEKYKTSLVTKGFNRKECVDNKEIY